MIDIKRSLFAMQDLNYKDFQSRLMPTVDPDTVIGVRMPDLRSLVRKLTPDEKKSFIACLPHEYYEENNVHALIIEKLTDFDECVKALDSFLPYVNNWATCDIMAPKAFRKHPPGLIGQIKIWLASKDVYTVRFAIGMLMRFFLDGEFKPEYLDMVASISSEEYYIRMMQAWYFATAFAKQYDAALPVIKDKKLAPWTHKKTIQKACESFRVPKETKEYLKTLL